MSGLPEDQWDDSVYRAIYDAIPSPLLVVNSRLDICHCNQAAALLAGMDQGTLPGQKIGTALGCIHPCAQNGPGTWPEPCFHCVLRQAVEAAFQGQSVPRQWAHVEQLLEGRHTRVNLQVACQPITHQGQPAALLILDGLSA